jgi:hypothetical protein
MSLAAATIRADGEVLVAAPDGVQLRVLRFRSRTRPAAGRVLFVPGFLSFIESWELVLMEIAERFDVDYFESREKHSSIVQRRSRFRIAELVADLGAAVRRLGLAAGEFDVVASCAGAATVLRAHADAGLRPRRMVWIAPTLRPVVPWVVVPLSMVLRGPLYVLLQKIAIAWYRRVLNPPGKDAFQHSRFMDVVSGADPFKATRVARDIYGLAVDPGLARWVQAPVLILAASEDLSHRFADSVRLARLLPGGRLRDLGAFWRTHAPAAGRAIVHFLTAPLPPSAGGRGDAAGAADAAVR